MGEEDINGGSLAERRGFVQRLSAHDDVRRVDFTRDGFRMILVELKPGAEFRDQWHQTATHLGYTVDQLGTETSWSVWPANAWILRLTAPDQSTDRATWRTTVQRAVTRIRSVRDRLFGRSNR